MTGAKSRSVSNGNDLLSVEFTASVLVFALNNTSTMYEMVQNAYKVTLVGAFVLARRDNA